MKFKLELIGNKCNNEYPHLTISHNRKIVYSDFVKEKTILELDIDLEDCNTISLNGIGKSNGKNNKWDTVVDSNGAILEDKNLLINSICFNGIAMPSHWVQALIIRTEDNSEIACNMGMWNNGCIEISINLPLLDWIIYEKFIKDDHTRTSSNEYNGGARFNYDYVQEKINLINKLLQ